MGGEMMMRHLATVCLIYISLVLQSCVASHLAFHSFRPWFPGIGLAIVVLLHTDVAGLIWAGILGLVVDGLSAERLGVHLVVSTFVAMGLLMTRHDVHSNRTVLLVVFVFAGSMFWRIVSMTTHAMLVGRDADLTGLLTIAVADGLYTSVLTVGIALLICLFQKLFGRRETPKSIMLSNRWAMLTR